MSQLAKLFIRGSLVNKTAKHLNTEQKHEVEKLMQIAWDDPELDSAKIEFCSILRRTIGNEYADREFALSEIWITFWRTAVNILYHAPARGDTEETDKKYQDWLNRKEAITTNPIARKKYFKTYLYQYMRQILNENKIQMRSVIKTISGPANEVALELIEFYIQNSGAKKIDFQTNRDNRNLTITCKINLLPITTLKKICAVRDEFVDYDAYLEISDDKIVIKTGDDVKFISKKLKDKERAKFNSMSGFNDDETKNSFQQHCEYQAVNKMEVDVDNMLVRDQINTLAGRLTPEAAKVLELMVNPPKDFLDEFYPRRKKEVRPRESHIAQWLGISKNTVTKHVEIIRKQATALDIG